MRAFWNIHEPGCNEHYLVHVLRDSEDYLPELSRVAEVNGEIVGAIFYSKAWVDDGKQRHNIVTFGPLAVDPMAQNLGVGKMLLEETIPLVRDAGYPGICIFGEPEYYPKRGFVTCDNFKITDENGNNFDALLGIETSSGSLSSVNGKLFESKVFEQCDDKEKIALFNKEFPVYPMYKVPSQWLHEQKLGKVIEEKDGEYLIEFWEAKLEAVFDSSFKGGKPCKGDLVTFVNGRDGKCRILTVEQEL